MVAIFAKKNSVQAKALSDKVIELSGKAPFFFDIDIPISQKVSLSEKEAFLEDKNLIDEISTVYTHQVRYENPVVPKDSTASDFSLWQYGHIIDQQKSSFIYSFLSRLEENKKYMINPISSHVEHFGLFSFLEKLKLNDVNLPDLIISNNNQKIDEFRDKHKKIIWKDVTLKSMWQKFEQKQQKALISKENPPVMIAEIKSGQMIRCYVINNRPVLALKCFAPTISDIEELEYFSVLEDSFLGSIEEEVAKIAKVKEINFAQMIFVLSDDDKKAFLYDIDIDPVISDMPQDIFSYLIDLLAKNLLNPQKKVCPDMKKFDKNKYYKREAIFQRRMLQILFDIEATKYPKE